MLKKALSSHLQILQQVGGILEMPVHHMRGGTSTGLILWERLIPKKQNLREELIRHLMGVPLFGIDETNRQITGLGRGVATSNKVFLVDTRKSNKGRVELISTLAQLASNHSNIDWSVNCGNMSSAIQLWAIDVGLLPMNTTNEQNNCQVEIFNTNTGISTLSRMMMKDENQNQNQFETCAIAGVPGDFPRVDLILKDPAGNITQSLLPTGKVIDEIKIEGGDTISISCVDVAVPMVIINASSLGKTGKESMSELTSDKEFLEKLRYLWIQGGILMNLRHKEGQKYTGKGQLMTRDEIEKSETIPKVCIVSPRSNAEKSGNITVRYFTPQMGHSSMAVSGGCCLAAACIIPGTVANSLVKDLDTSALSTDKSVEILVSIEHPAGLLDAVIEAQLNPEEQGGQVQIDTAAYLRSTQILLRGHTPLYQASEELRNSLLQISRESNFEAN